MLVTVINAFVNLKLKLGGFQTRPGLKRSNNKLSQTLFTSLIAGSQAVPSGTGILDLNLDLNLGEGGLLSDLLGGTIKSLTDLLDKLLGTTKSGVVDVKELVAKIQQIITYLIKYLKEILGKGNGITEEVRKTVQDLIKALEDLLKNVGYITSCTTQESIINLDGLLKNILNEVGYLLKGVLGSTAGTGLIESLGKALTCILDALKINLGLNVGIA
ncbi:jg26438 [Pararge aegeria aegeria]|uniref:Jg26438 protein n=1 Tax=Pararge aegeria aegeria TaxID=348720 RepID=A0A8S4QZ70_9NEOP|nr:jg26438 [Pararge aegeria aegeria]